ncbi:hypothetical protein JOM56_012799, partial [Amanita muscaria]
YWEALIPLRDTQDKWRKAWSILKKAVGDPKLLSSAAMALNDIPWAGCVQGFPRNATEETRTLTRFLTSEWLMGEHINQILALLYDDLVQCGISGVKIEGTYFYHAIAEAARDLQAYASDKRYRTHREAAHAVEMGVYDYLALIAHINSNHYIALVLDFRKSIIWYADSLSNKHSADVERNLKQWTYFHTGRNFQLQALPITQQADTYSCGLLSCNAIANFFIPASQPLIKADHVAVERLKVFLAIVQRH